MRNDLHFNVHAVVAGVLVAVALSAITVPLFKLQIAPWPVPPALAFANTIFGQSMPLVVGLLFHLVYVTFWSYIYFVFLAKPNSLLRAFALAAALWLVALFVLFPFVGWGLGGLAATQKAPVAALIPHALFGLFIWLAAKTAYLNAGMGALREPVQDHEPPQSTD